MITLIDPIVFIATVLAIALITWLVRSLAESDPDPILLNFTLFAFAGQFAVTGQMVRENNARSLIFGLLLVEMILVILHIFIVRAQKTKTFEHYLSLLQQNKVGNLASDEVERWAAVLLRVTGVDFYPEFYTSRSDVLPYGPRARRRVQAIAILPSDKFNCGTNGVTPEALVIPADARHWLWRLYAITSLNAWIVFVVSVLLATRRQ